MMTLLFLESYRFYRLCITEILHPHESCIFNDIEMYFMKSVRYSCSHDVTDFLFSFYNGPFAGFIYLEMMGNYSYKCQSMVHIKPFNFFF